MKFLKKNQVVIYVIALMLVVAGYLNYVPQNDQSAIQTSSDVEELMQFANIGDAQLVSSNDVVGNEIQQANSQNNTEEQNVTVQENATKNTNTTETITTSAKTNQDYFTTSKLERDTMYSQMIETYEKVLNSANSLETQKQSATAEITKINDIKNSIMISENLIKTKGFENNIIFVNGESISVIIGKQNGEELKQEEVAQIQNIIAREMKAEIENIHIATK